MGEFLKNINWKHVLIMCIGNVFAGMGIGIFKLAGLGTDPFSGMNMAVAPCKTQKPQETTKSNKKRHPADHII